MRSYWSMAAIMLLYMLSRIKWGEFDENNVYPS